MLLLKGVQSTAKFNAKERDLVYLHLGVLRLKKHGTDVLMVHYHAMSPESIGSAASPRDKSHAQQIEDKTLATLHADFPIWFQSIKVLDASLFVN